MKRTTVRLRPRRCVAWLAAMLLTSSNCWLAVTPSAIAQQVTSEFQEFKVQHLSPEDAKRQITRIMGNSVEVIADTEGKRLLLRGPAESLRISRNVMASIDKPSVAPAIPVTTKKAAFQVPANRQPEIARYLQSIYGADAGISVTTDATQSQLIIQAPEQTLGEIGEILAVQGFRPVVAAVGNNLQNQERVTETYRLRNINYRELESVLVATWGSDLTVQSLMQGKRVVVQLPVPGMQRSPASMTIDRIGNQIILEGFTGYVTAWKRAVMAVDAPPKQYNDSIAWLKTQQSDPSGLRKAVSYLRLSSDPRIQQTATLPQRRTPVIGPDGRRMTAQTISARMPQEEASPLGQDPMPEGGQEGDETATDDGQSPIGAVELEFIEELGIVIVKGAPEDVARVRKLIKEIEDIANQTQPEVRFYNLEHVDSTAVATIAQELYDNIYQARQGAVTISTLGKPNAVLLVGRKEAVDFVETLLKELDVPSTPDSEFRIFRLKYMSSEDMKNRINEFYLGVSTTGQIAGGAIAQGERPGLGTRVRVISDYRSNSIVIQASPTDIGEIERFIKELDVVDSEATNEVKIFRLKNALAEELQPVLQDALNGQLQGQGLGANPGGANAQTNQQFGVGQQQLARVRSAMLALNITNEDGEIIRGGIMYDVRVTADVNSNSLVVTGPPENMSLIAALIESFDQLPDVETKLKVFSVVNNDAGVLLQLLTDLFSTGQQGGQQGGLGSLPVQSASAGGDSTLVGLRFTADPRTNSIIASGSDSNLRVVEDLLYRLDQPDLHQRVVKVFRLRNTLSDNVVAAVQDWIGQRAELYGDGGDAVGVPFVREIIVVSEPEGNSLIVGAEPDYFPEIERIIEELDRRPMFMIHTLIAEVDLGSVDEFGFEWGIQDSIVFNRGLGVAPAAGIASIDNPFNVPGVGTSSQPFLNENLAGLAISSLGMGRTNNNLGYGGLVMSAGNESVNLLLRALRARNRLQILSSPTIMTLDNLQGFVQVGEQVRFLTGSTISQGVVQNTVEPVDTGIILQVRPRLSPDGMIVMEVDATNSSLGNDADGTTVGVDQNGNPIRIPPINITTAQTTIMARHGQTTVFAGLITTIDETETRGVPILSTIPAVGRLFRFDSERQVRSELLIILTPYIVNDEADVAAINQVAMDRMSWCMTDVANVYGPIGYDNGEMMFEHEPDVIYPDLDPSGTSPQNAPLPPPPSGTLESPSYDSGTGMLRGPALGTGVNTRPVGTESTRRSGSEDSSAGVRPAVLQGNYRAGEPMQVRPASGVQYPYSGSNPGSPVQYQAPVPASNGSFRPMSPSGNYPQPGGGGYR